MFHILGEEEGEDSVCAGREGLVKGDGEVWGLIYLL